MYISIQDLLIFMVVFIIFIMLVVASVYLIITLSSFNKLLNRAHKIMDTNEGNINKSLSVLPVALENINELAGSVKGNVDKLGSTISNLETAVIETSTAVSEGTENIFSLVEIVTNVAKIVINLFSKTDGK